MSDEHTHVWPKFGQGCHCGAKQCLAKVQPEPTYFCMRPKPRRCTNAAISPAHEYCETHQENM